MNPKCVNCYKQRKNSPDRCICNSEIRCSSCKSCSWCIDENMNGKCTPNDQFNPVNCPYSFNHNRSHYNHLFTNLFMLFFALIIMMIFIYILLQK